MAEPNPDDPLMADIVSQTSSYPTFEKHLQIGCELQICCKLVAIGIMFVNT